MIATLALLVLAGAALLYWSQDVLRAKAAAIAISCVVLLSSRVALTVERDDWRFVAEVLGATTYVCMAMWLWLCRQYTQARGRGIKVAAALNMQLPLLAGFQQQEAKRILHRILALLACARKNEVSSIHFLLIWAHMRRYDADLMRDAERHAENASAEIYLANVLELASTLPLARVHFTA